ncbi:MAG: hypothetical protein ACPHTD_15580, partial [Gammaproteobacteria bacterium]
AEAVAEARAGYASRDRARITAAISDDMVRRIFGFGDEAHWHTSIREDLAGGVASIVISPQAADAAGFVRGAEAFSRARFNPEH